MNRSFAGVNRNCSDQFIKVINMSHLQRMKDELSELGVRLNKLNDFINMSDIYKTLDPDEKFLMEQQYIAMDRYYDMLKRRIKRQS
ncbi:hypothetical protein FDI46_gp210 [Aeromonas phage AS-gz]|uniref:Uncharacterized protein n=3 Tax=Tulanevirus TaxID=2560244 RepID=A0A898K9G0_9CAUD|nr:hypothetical protein FDI46_gp210 [Aeromonas phage AS-gz]ASU00746.1 hypothetical protein [Aeromonas phage AS-gz]QSJ03505.1 hypothetical protein [Aeromonas phage vB_AsM_ZHF]